jgi:hypothetical protein
MSQDTLARRIAAERRIARRLVRDALAAGYTISVDNGEGEEGPFKTETKTLDAMFATDEEHLFFFDAAGSKIGWVFFVYGNDGWDVISDYTTNLESLMPGANEVADAFERSESRRAA